MDDKLPHAILKLFSNKRILVTGASGFIGYNLATRLYELGADVIGTSRTARLNTDERISWLQCSFSDFDATTKILEEIKPQIIFHLSGEVTASGDSKHVLPTFHSLVTSTVNVLTAARNLNVERIVLTGSCTEPNELETPSASPYAAAKSATRTYGKMFWQCYQTPVVIVRPFVGYGPGQNAGKLIPHVISSFFKKEAPLLTSGKWLSDWIYIDDIIEGMIASSLAPNIEGATIDLGTGVLTSVKDVVLQIKEITGSQLMPTFGALPDRADEFSRLANVDETKSILNWSAKIPLRDGLFKTVSAYREGFA
jgi:nucleoside-diphosphate-sugar epimerase